MRRSSSFALLALPGLSASLACTPELAESASPGPGWPDLGDPPAGRHDGRADAALLIAIDEPALGGRPGAWALASGWWRYLVTTRGLRPSHVRLLRNEEATPDQVRRALESMAHQAGEGAMLWVVFIGAGESSSLGQARLRVSEGEVELVELLERLGAGYHESAFLLLDACTEAPREGWRGGVPADTRVLGRALGRPAPVDDQLDLEVDPAPSDSFLLDLARSIGSAAMAEQRGLPRNVFVLTAGVEPSCQAELAGLRWPALAYAALGGLQGWADANGDGWVSAIELAVYAQALLGDLDHDEGAEHEIDRSTRLQASGVDLMLADLAGLGPRPSPLARQRRESPALDPGLASLTDEALVDARARIDLSVEDMIAVAPGRFTMGCEREHERECENDELPDRRIELGGFALDRHEVSWAEYRVCEAAGACPEPDIDTCWVWTGQRLDLGAPLPEAMLAGDHPVVCVSWIEAANYCDAVGKRLPSEAEWERAARGLDGRRYPWGDRAPSCSQAVMSGCSDFGEAVGSRPAGASPSGALDMAGNVAEWVFDWWDAHSYRNLAPGRDPLGVWQGEVRVVRGGSFYSGPSDLRASYRYGIEPDARTSLVGFRCAR